VNQARLYGSATTLTVQSRDLAGDIVGAVANVVGA